jgi:hypothetical protein
MLIGTEDAVKSKRSPPKRIASAHRIYKRKNHTQPIVSRNGRHYVSTTLRLARASRADSPQEPSIYCAA